MAKQPFPPIGTHLASLNLFVEVDGTFEITVSGGSPAIAEMMKREAFEGRPIDYIESLIVKAAQRMKDRING